MAAGEFTLTNAGQLNWAKGDIDLDSNTITAVLVLETHTPNIATDATYNDIITNECADGDYAAVDLTGKTLAEASAGVVEFDAAQVDFGNPVSITAKYIYLVQKAGASLVAGDLIFGFMDLNTAGGSVGSVNSDFKVNWNAVNGILRLTKLP